MRGLTPASQQFTSCVPCSSEQPIARADAYTARKQSGQVPQPEDLVKEVRSFGRSTVPDIVKAELLAELCDFIS